VRWAGINEGNKSVEGCQAQRELTQRKLSARQFPGNGLNGAAAIHPQLN
jgi:hypothetical protein